MLLKFLEFLKGYVIIKIMGFSPERFMNLCSNHNILLWNIENHGDYYIMKISIKGLFQIKGLLKKTKTKVVIIEKYGLPFLLPKIITRKFFVFGLFGCILAMILLSNYIWSIEIEGNISITDDQFMDYLEEKGIDYGVKKSLIPISELEKDIRKDYTIITWTSIQIKGNKLIIFIKENEYENVNTTKKEGASNLISHKTGKIDSIITRSGVPQVKEGDLVEKGDVLIAGQIPIVGDDGVITNYQYCHSDGDIVIKYLYSYREVLDLHYQEKSYTNREKEVPILNIGKYEILLSFEKNPFISYDEIVEAKSWKMAELLNIPISYGKKTIRENYIQDSIYTEKEAISILNRRFIEFIEELEKKGVQIIQKNVKIEKIGNKMYHNGAIILLEETGIVNEIEEIEQIGEIHENEEKSENNQ